MKSIVDRFSWFSLFVIIEVIVSVFAAFFINPIVDSESIWSHIIVGFIVFTNTFVVIGVLLSLYYKQVKSGEATSLIVKISSIFLVLFIILTAILIFISQIK